MTDKLTITDERKRREQGFSDIKFGTDRETDPKFTARNKWYFVGQAANEWMDDWLRRNAPRKRVLDYACGEGGKTVRTAKLGCTVTGIDISPVLIDIARRRAADAGVMVDFQVMDAEHTEFEDNAFDIVICSGSLHHMDLSKAFPEIARILKPDGTVIGGEASGENPLIRLYRRFTPDLRTPDEHPLVLRDFNLARRYFSGVEVRYFSLAVLAAAPLHKTPLFKPALRLLRRVDNVLVTTPFVQRQAWMVGLLLTKPGR